MKPGARLRLLRIALEKTQPELAKRAGFRQSTVSAMESDRHVPRKSTVDAVAGALGVPPAALEDDVACFRELARIVGADVPIGQFSAEDDAFTRELRALAGKLGPERTGYLLQIVRGLAGTMLTPPPATFGDD